MRYPPLRMAWEIILMLCTPSAYRFLLRPTPYATLAQRMGLLYRFATISAHVECVHKNDEMIAVASAVFGMPRRASGVVVEAGSYMGGSTAKLSIVAKLAGRQLVVFDSFMGIPANREVHTYFRSRKPGFFVRGRYKGTLSQVKRSVASYGEPGVCRYVKGWFDKTMPTFHEPVAAMFLDVDLAESTRVCLRYLYPLLVSGGACFSQDGHLTRVIEVFDDDRFWKRVVGVPKPKAEGLWSKQLIRIIKK